MIYYTRGGVIAHFGRDYELNHQKNYKRRKLQPGDILLTTHKIRVVLCEENYDGCKVLENGRIIEFIHQEQNLYSVPCS